MGKGVGMGDVFQRDKTLDNDILASKKEVYDPCLTFIH